MPAGRTVLLTMVSVVPAFTIGHLLAEVAPPAGGPTATPAEAAPVIADYPHPARAVAGGHDAAEQFEFALASLLDGFARRRLEQ